LTLTLNPDSAPAGLAKNRQNLTPRPGGFARAKTPFPGADRGGPKPSRSRHAGRGTRSRARDPRDTFYTWRRRFGGLGTPEIRELRQLREENAKLKSIVADLSLDRKMLQEIISKKR
jgi:hypothetical protein